MQPITSCVVSSLSLLIQASGRRMSPIGMMPLGVTCHQGSGSSTKVKDVRFLEAIQACYEELSRGDLVLPSTSAIGPAVGPCRTSLLFLSSSDGGFSMGQQNLVNKGSAPDTSGQGRAPP